MRKKTNGRVEFELSSTWGNVSGFISFGDDKSVRKSLIFVLTFRLLI